MSLNSSGGIPATATAPEIIEVTASPDLAGLRWQPVEGPETLALVEHLGLSQDSSDQLVREAIRVLGQCMPPTGPDARNTGLVIGYVQSGKTMSFTTVSALARDNGYKLIIVCTGVTVPLFKQSKDRLELDLRLNQRDDRHWVFLANPRATAHTRQMVATALEGDDELPGLPRQTVLMAIMKNGTHLDHVRQLLESLPLAGLPTLVIDDEADQASLNNLVQQGRETATYRRMVQLRTLFPHTTFLQYTATPQALLLINLIDVLSPAFAEVLTPGPSYTGGEVFFENGRALIREIPPGDIPSPANQLTGPPESLLEAMRIFMLGVAVGMSQGAQGNRSMMVHPSQRTLPHADYASWVRQIQISWRDILALNPTDADYLDLVDDFRAALDEIRTTVPSVPPLDALLPYLKAGIRRTVVTEMNAASGPTPRPEWRQTYSNIVVGGEVLNRGVTIQGLTVTYMPRGIGTRQADTIQQRARWFGYKEDYLGYCRVYLSSNLVDAYRAYVEHEEHLREQLRKHRESGGSLREWRRAFFLDANLRPTRNSVIDVDLQRGGFSDDWYQTHAPHDAEAFETNRTVVAEFLGSIEGLFRRDEGDPRRTPATIHDVVRQIRLDRIHRDLLTKLRATRPCDSAPFAGLLLQVARYLEDHPDATGTVYRMSPGEQRTRTPDPSNEIENLLQGANYDRTKNPPEETYPGDREMMTPGELTVQIHDLTVLGAPTIEHVPAIAVWVPQVMAKDWVVQTE
jgi:hypothetical protein